MGRVLLYTERVSGESHWRVCVVNCCDKAGCGMLAMVWCKRTVSGTTASHTEFVAPPPPGLRTAEKKRSDVKCQEILHARFLLNGESYMYKNSINRITSTTNSVKADDGCWLVACTICLKAFANRFLLNTLFRGFRTASWFEGKDIQGSSSPNFFGITPGMMSTLQMTQESWHRFSFARNKLQIQMRKGHFGQQLNSLTLKRGRERESFLLCRAKSIWKLSICLTHYLIT